MKLYNTITKDNWIQGTLIKSDRKCLLGHLGHKHKDVFDYMEENFLNDRDALLNVIRICYPTRAWGGGISSFNDHPETTVDDILHVCKVADV